jgi:hypothetical protein
MGWVTDRPVARPVTWPAHNVHPLLATSQNLLLPLPAVGDNAAMQTEPRKTDPPKRKRRWFQFSLRSLLIGVTLTAVGCGYVARQAEVVRERQAFLDRIVRMGGCYNNDSRKLFGSMPESNRLFLLRYCGGSRDRPIRLLVLGAAVVDALALSGDWRCLVRAAVAPAAAQHHLTTDHQLAAEMTDDDR